MAKFADVWDNEVKALAVACVDVKFMEMLSAASKRGYATEEEKAYGIEHNLKDPDGMWDASALIWRVEHDLADRRLAMAMISIHSLYSYLNSESYAQVIWDGDTSSEEAQRMLRLRDGLAKLLAAER